MELFGRTIAKYSANDRRIVLDDCSWQTQETKEQLNAILAEAGSEWEITCHNFKWILHHITGGFLEWNPPMPIRLK
jgi:hypothetical protein